MTFREFLQNYRQKNGSPLSSASIEKYGVQGPSWLEKRIPIEDLIELAASGKESLPVQQLYDKFYESHNKAEGNYMWHVSFKYLCQYEKSQLDSHQAQSTIYAQVSDSDDNHPEEVSGCDTYIEGATKQITVNAYERNRQARQACLDHWGCKCLVCEFDFEEVYGERGRGFIHVYHVVPLNELGHKYEVNPITDLRPLCPNCHAMIHKNPQYDISHLTALVR
jgi:5-methylcytosine-specific restriction protein A